MCRRVPPDPPGKVPRRRSRHSTVSSGTDSVIRAFQERHNKDVVPAYESREDRNRWASSVIRSYPGSRLLNLGGGGKRHLGKHLGAQWDVHEVDITGDCDTLLNLDEIDRLPFDDNSFDTSCAFEVLEHLEQFHLLVDEMFRVTRSTILLSLPNAFVEARQVLRNHRPYDNPLENGVYSKFYGLPLEKPGDRHRWWLTFEDIVRFFVHLESRRACRIEFYIPHLEPTTTRKIIRRLAGDRVFLNLFCSNVWIKLDKANA